MTSLLIKLLYGLSVATLFIGVSEARDMDRFPLVVEGHTAQIVFDTQDYPVVGIACEDLSEDIERVSGVRPEVSHGIPASSKMIVLVGTLGKSKLIDGLVKSGKLSVKAIEGKWESYVRTTLSNPFSGVEEVLVIVGSDRRGTAYGVYDVSRQIGVSPWYWWADVHPLKQKTLHLSGETVTVGSPGVKYRGIFINDEMWGIRPWAEGHFAPHEGKGLGPTSYARVFELLLRLRANTLWPAMHLHTEPFNSYADNKVVADRYAIVMGSSHIEPMLRNNMLHAEWDREGHGEWNYKTNRDAIYRYWEQGIRRNGSYENLYTLGMRGQDDEAMQGGETLQEKVDILDRVLKDQREILSRQVAPDVTRIPQVFVAYREVLGLYESGLALPDDVIMCWPDDNFGYLRRLPSEAEQKRQGGSGIYYHLQWLNGATSAYSWLNTMPVSLIFNEMNKAWQYDCRSLWMLNVGDIKPYEIGMDFFLEMAWNPDAWTHANIGDYLKQWAARDIDPRFSDEIAQIMKDYYELGLARRPEHLVQYRKDSPLRYSWFSHQHYGDEASRRLRRYQRLSQQVQAIYDQLPKERKDAFFQLVQYPVQCAALMNTKIIHADLNQRDAAHGRASALGHAEKALAAEHSIIALTERYNSGLVQVGDKWRYMMHWAPGPWGHQRHQFEMPPLNSFNGLGKPWLSVVPEGDDAEQTPDISRFTKRKRFVDLYNTGKGQVSWTADMDESWLTLSLTSGCFSASQRVWVDVDWTQVPLGSNILGSIRFASDKREQEIRVPVFNPPDPALGEWEGYIESHGYVSMEAEHFTRRIDRRGAGWEVVENLGRSGDAVGVYSAKRQLAAHPSLNPTNNPGLSYDFYVFTPGRFQLHMDCLPTQPITKGRGTRLAVSLDGKRPQVLDPGVLKKSRDHAQWEVLSNLRRLKGEITIAESGKHSFTLWALDPGVVVDRITLYRSTPPQSCLGPRESARYRVDFE